MPRARHRQDCDVEWENRRTQVFEVNREPDSTQVLHPLLQYRVPKDLICRGVPPWAPITSIIMLFPQKRAPREGRPYRIIQPYRSRHFLASQYDCHARLFFARALTTTSKYCLSFFASSGLSLRTVPSSCRAIWKPSIEPLPK